MIENGDELCHGNERSRDFISEILFEWKQMFKQENGNRHFVLYQNALNNNCA